MFKNQIYMWFVADICGSCNYQIIVWCLTINIIVYPRVGNFIYWSYSMIIQQKEKSKWMRENWRIDFFQFRKYLSSGYIDASYWISRNHSQVLIRVYQQILTIHISIFLSETFTLIWWTQFCCWRISLWQCLFWEKKGVKEK